MCRPLPPKRPRPTPSLTIPPLRPQAPRGTLSALALLAAASRPARISAAYDTVCAEWGRLVACAAQLRPKAPRPDASPSLVLVLFTSLSNPTYNVSSFLCTYTLTAGKSPTVLTGTALYSDAFVSAVLPGPAGAPALAGAHITGVVAHADATGVALQDTSVAGGGATLWIGDVNLFDSQLLNATGPKGALTVGTLVTFTFPSGSAGGSLLQPLVQGNGATNRFFAIGAANSRANTAIAAAQFACAGAGTVANLSACPAVAAGGYVAVGPNAAPLPTGVTSVCDATTPPTSAPYLVAGLQTYMSVAGVYAPPSVCTYDFGCGANAAANNGDPTAAWNNSAYCANGCLLFPDDSYLSLEESCVAGAAPTTGRVYYVAGAAQLDPADLDPSFVSCGASPASTLIPGGPSGGGGGGGTASSSSSSCFGLSADGCDGVIAAIAIGGALVMCLCLTLLWFRVLRKKAFDRGSVRGARTSRAAAASPFPAAPRRLAR